jgi:hypothetical protein
LRYPVVLLLSVPLLVTACSDVKAPDQLTPAARPETRRITIDPGGLTFEIPAYWVTYLSRGQLAGVENPERDEWDTEYARARNAALPFNRCVAHVGSEPWGEKGESYADLQISVYEVLDDLKDLEEHIVKTAPATLHQQEVKVQRETIGGWRRVLISFMGWHFDYGAPAAIVFRLRKFGERGVVFVFMQAGYPNKITEEIPRILSSVRVPNT